MGMKRINGYKTALTASTTAAATSITVSDGSRLALAAGEFYLMTLYKNTTFEIVKVTAVVGNTLTIERAQEGSTAQAWAVGVAVACAPTAGDLNGIDAKIGDIGAALTAILGA